MTAKMSPWLDDRGAASARFPGFVIRSISVRESSAFGRMSAGGKAASAGMVFDASSNSVRAGLRSLREPMAETIFVSLAMAVPLPLSGHMVLVPIVITGEIDSCANLTREQSSKGGRIPGVRRMMEIEPPLLHSHQAYVAAGRPSTFCRYCEVRPNPRRG